MNFHEARAIVAASLDCRELEHALHAAGGVADGVSAPLLRMQEHMGPLVDEARRMLAPADEIDPDEAREAVRETRYVPTEEDEMGWDEDVAGGAAIEDICKATRAIDDASADLADAAARAKGVPELEQAGVVERIEGDVQPRLSEAWAALRGVEELATNAMVGMGDGK